MLKRLVITLFLFGFASPALADDTSRTNELFVEAVQLLQSADDPVSVEERLNFLEEALGNLQEIVKRYPSTDLAVKLISGQDTGNISLAGVAEVVEEARSYWRCLSAPNYACVIAKVSFMFDLLVCARAEAGDIQGAKKNVAQVLSYADTQKGLMRVRVLTMIACSQAKVGDIKGAKESIAEVLAFAKTEDATGRAQMLALIASAQAEVGDIKGAMESIAEVLAFAKTKSAQKRARVRALIASVQAEVGDIKGAKESIAEVLSYAKTKGAEDRAFVLGFIASAQAEVGDIKGAKESISETLGYVKITNAKDLAEKDRDGFLAYVAKALAKME